VQIKKTNKQKAKNPSFVGPFLTNRQEIGPPRQLGRDQGLYPWLGHGRFIQKLYFSEKLT